MSPLSRISFRTRLTVAASIWIALGLGIGWLVIDRVLREHLTEEFREEMLHHGTELANLFERGSDGAPRLRHALSDRRFYQAGSGYYWEIDTTDGVVLRSVSLGDARLPSAPDGSSPVRVAGPAGKLFLLELPLADDAGATLRLGIDQHILDKMTSRLDRVLAWAFGCIATGLWLALVAQVTYGLWPLHRVGLHLMAIRRGEQRLMPEDLPPEVTPLTSSLNQMILANDEVVQRARIQAANLAHALRTPLAVLLDEAGRLEAAGYDGSSIRRQCDRMRRQIDYQLSRARAGASRGRPYATAPVMPAIRRITAALSRLPSTRRVVFDLAAVDPALAVMCDHEDLDEILGNLVDNATKWARTAVRITAVGEAQNTVRIDVEDDGPGMPSEARELVFTVGERLDEHKPGTGLGLAIVREVVELYGGTVWLGTSSLGGVTAHVRLPGSTIANGAPVRRTGRGTVWRSKAEMDVAIAVGGDRGVAP